MRRNEPDRGLDEKRPAQYGQDDPTSWLARTWLRGPACTRRAVITASVVIAIWIVASVGGAGNTPASGPSHGDGTPSSQPTSHAATQPSTTASSSATGVEPVTLGATEEAARTANRAVCEGLDRRDEVWTPPTGDFVLRDHQSGSLWNLRGEAFDGACAGVTLEQVPAFTAFWFAWSSFYHGSTIWGQDDPNDPGPIEATGACEVPCDEIRSGGPPPDGIPALDHAGRDDRPRPAPMTPAGSDDASWLHDDDIVLGVVLDGVARAYPHRLLWWHEIFVDEIAGRQVNVTFCPLTGSGIAFSGQREDARIRFFVSGKLFNSNLVMMEREAAEPTLWSQMLLEGIRGPHRGEQLDVLPIVETTWARWRRIHPETMVATDETGYRRDYGRYPYGDYEQSERLHAPMSPPPEEDYHPKARVLGIPDDVRARAYPYPELSEHGDRVVLNDAVGARPVVIVHEAPTRLTIPFYRSVGEDVLTFEGALAE